jgi:hypothetical protein
MKFSMTRTCGQVVLWSTPNRLSLLNMSDYVVSNYSEVLFEHDYVNYESS